MNTMIMTHAMRNDQFCSNLISLNNFFTLNSNSFPIIYYLIIPMCTFFLLTSVAIFGLCGTVGA